MCIIFTNLHQVFKSCDETNILLILKFWQGKGTWTLMQSAIQSSKMVNQWQDQKLQLRVTGALLDKSRCD